MLQGKYQLNQSEMLFKTRRDRRFRLLVGGPQRLSLSAHHCQTIGIQTDVTAAQLLTTALAS